MSQTTHASGFNSKRKKYELTDEQQKKLMSLDEYRKFVIKRLQVEKLFFGDCIVRILKSDELISDIIYSVIDADCSFNPNKSALNTYRINHIRWKIGDILRKEANNRKKFKILKQMPIKEHTNNIYEYEEQEEQEYRINLIKSKLKNLSEKERLFMESYYIQGKTAIEIAEENNCQVQTVYTKIKSSKQKLKDIFGVK